MSDYPHRVMSAFLASELIPAWLRNKLMRAVGFNISKNVTIWSGVTLRSKKITVETGCFINTGFFYDGRDTLHIGKYVATGPFVRIYTSAHDIGPSNHRCMPALARSPVVLDDGCWIGAGSVIMPGVTVAKGCVISTNSVVYESTEENGIYAGNPARRVRELEP